MDTSDKTSSSFRSIGIAAYSTVLAATIVWLGSGVFSFVHGVYDLRDTVAARGQVLARFEKLLEESNGAARRLDSFESRLKRDEERLDELWAFKTQGRRYTAEDADRDRARVDGIEGRCNQQREEQAQKFGNLEARMNAVESLLGKRK